jgi:hypothetical protein
MTMPTASFVGAQSNQTLPQVAQSVLGGTDPFGTTADQVWQWHYDSSQFQFQGPLIITEIYVRPFDNGVVPAFSFLFVEVLISSSPTNYTATPVGPQPGHDPVFANNLNPGAIVVRPASPWVGGQTTSDWIPFGLTTAFTYNPFLGLDLVVQVRKCGTVTPFAAPILYSCGGPGINGGNRYGDRANCLATQQSTSGSGTECVPVIRIDYLLNNEFAISQSGPGVGDLRVTLTRLSPTGVEGWTLASAATTLGQAGAGPIMGLWPDPLTLQVVALPYAPGSPFHFRATDPGVFPHTPFILPAGAMTSVAGATLDFVAVLLNASSRYDSQSNVVRITFE